ncbi:unnamed protein product [Pylaiella littoralis]
MALGEVGSTGPPVMDSPPPLLRPGVGTSARSAAARGGAASSFSASSRLAESLARAELILQREHEKGLLYRQGPEGVAVAVAGEELPLPPAARVFFPLSDAMPRTTMDGADEPSSSEDDKDDSLGDILARADQSPGNLMKTFQMLNDREGNSLEKLNAAASAEGADDEAKARSADDDMSFDASSTGDSLIGKVTGTLGRFYALPENKGGSLPQQGPEGVAAADAREEPPRQPAAVVSLPLSDAMPRASMGGADEPSSSDDDKIKSLGDILAHTDQGSGYLKKVFRTLDDQEGNRLEKLDAAAGAGGADDEAKARSADNDDTSSDARSTDDSRLAEILPDADRGSLREREKGSLSPQRETVASHEPEGNVPERHRSPSRVGEAGATGRERASSFRRGGDADHVFQKQLLSSVGLDEITSINPEALEEVQRVIKVLPAGSFSVDTNLGSTEKRRRLDRLVAMAKELGEIVVRHAEDKGETQRELALQPFAQAYYTAIMTGLCNAYLAASVVGSSWVSTSKTGRMGKAGKVVKLLSGVPLFGEVARLFGGALKAGDGYLQTRRLEKIGDLAPNVVECCSLARKLGLLLTDRLTDDAVATTDQADGLHEHVAASMNGLGGGSGSSNPPTDLPGTMSEEDLVDHVIEEMADSGPTDRGGKKLGKRHLRMLLQAVLRGCLKGTKNSEQKIAKLLVVVFPEVDIRPAATSSAPEETPAQPPVSAPSCEDSPDRESELAAMRAKVESQELTNAELRSDTRKTQVDLEALKLENETLVRQVEMLSLQSPVPAQPHRGGSDQDAEWEAMGPKFEPLELAYARLQSELEAVRLQNKELLKKVSSMEKRIPKPHTESTGLVDAKGGQALIRRQRVTETVDGFFERIQDRASMQDHPVMQSELRVIVAAHEERFRELELNDIRREGASDAKRRKWKCFWIVVGRR